MQYNASVVEGSKGLADEGTSTGQGSTVRTVRCMEYQVRSMEYGGTREIDETSSTTNGKKRRQTGRLRNIRELGNPDSSEQSKKQEQLGASRCVGVGTNGQT